MINALHVVYLGTVKSVFGRSEFSLLNLNSTLDAGRYERNDRNDDCAVGSSDGDRLSR